MSKDSRLELVVARWYAWQMFPGYADVPYCSPIRLDRVRPRGTGKGILTLDFWNLGYAEGVQDFSVDLRIRTRSRTFIFAELLDPPSHVDRRGAAITPLTVEWMLTFHGEDSLQFLPRDARLQLGIDGTSART